LPEQIEPVFAEVLHFGVGKLVPDYVGSMQDKFFQCQFDVVAVKKNDGINEKMFIPLMLDGVLNKQLSSTPVAFCV
jgi:hypothetical protein